jgi:hypothetical protein
MYIKKILIIALLTFEIPLFSQCRDIIYIDIGLVALYEVNIGFGINYERVINNHISFRTGLNIAFDIEGGPSYLTILGIPAGFNFFTGGNNRFELGIGSGGNFWLDRSHFGKIQPGLLLRTGYRYQKKNEEGKFFKAGLELPCNHYISFFGGGYGF